MEYGIVATLGPATAGEVEWKALLAAGATAFRLNTSHLTVEETETWVEKLTSFLTDYESRDTGTAAEAPTKRAATSIAVVLDLQGSKWRIGKIDDLVLEQGDRVELVPGSKLPDPDLAEEADRDATVIPVPHPELFEALGRTQGEIRLNDAKVVMAVQRVSPRLVEAVVTQAGPLSRWKGISVPGARYRNEALSTKDRRIVSVTRRHSRVRYAVSYVRDADEMRSYQSDVGADRYLIAKIERPTAVRDAPGIADFCNELWLCRGDLGAEMGLPAMARAVAGFADRLSSSGYTVPAVLAGQVLEHMSAHPAPTRSEICYLYDALTKGYAGVVLSDETAVGRYPMDACRTAALFRGYRTS